MKDKRRTSRLAPTKGEQRKQLEVEFWKQVKPTTIAQVIAIRRKGAAV